VVRDQRGQIHTLVVIAVVLVVVAGLLSATTYRDADVVALGRAPALTTAPTTTTTTATPLFPPLPVDRIGAVRTATGVVVPVLGGTAGAYRVRTPCGGDAVVDGTPIAAAHIVIDPGHGGDQEPGAVGPAGMQERELNLDIALRAKALLEADGATVVLTRETDIRVTLQTRSELALALQPLAFISIHHNAGAVHPSPIPGVEMYHQFEVGESARLGGLLYEELLTAFEAFDVQWVAGDRAGVRARRTAEGTDYYGVLRGTAGVPAVLSEAAFVSNPSEEAALATSEYRQAEADAIHRAVLRFVTSDAPGSGFAPSFVSAAAAGGGGGSSNCVDPPLG
jgi:N-acetylmuramoyl-L-alanine amidase